MDDRANNAYASLPERLYVVQDGRVVYQVGFKLQQCSCINVFIGGGVDDVERWNNIFSQGGLGPFDYRIGDVENFLKKTK